MITRTFLAAIACCAFSLVAFTSTAQLSDGTPAPDFVYDDTQGNTHDLQAYLDEGKTVVMMQFSAWAAPGLMYYQSGALQELHNTYGPEGTNDVVVLMVESDTSSDDPLDGTGSNDVGDFLTDNPIPVIQPTDWDFMDDWNVVYFPTIYSICTSGLVYEIGQMDYEELLLNVVIECGGDPNPVDYENNVGFVGDITMCSVNLPDVQILNDGNNPQENVEVGINVDGVVVDIIEIGTIAVDETVIVPFGDYGLQGGETVVVMIGNGSDIYPDDNLFDNMIQITVPLQTEGSNRLRISLTTDVFPDESSFAVYLYGEEEPLIETTPGNLNEYSTYTWEYYLNATDCYTFQMNDLFGDGLSGFGGIPGALTVTLRDEDGDLLYTVLEDYGEESWFMLQAQFTVTELLDPTYTVCVFNDLNENGTHDADEPAIPGVDIQADDLMVQTGDNGCVEINDTDLSSIAVLQDTEVFPNNTTPTSITFDGFSNAYVEFGISVNDPNYNMGVSYSQMEDYFCEFDTPLWIQVVNQGNAVSNGTLTMSLDPLLTILSFTEGGTQDGQTITWDIDALPVGAMAWFQVTVLAPNFESMGEIATNSASLVVYDPEGNVVESVHESNEHVITCSYDPNDKQVWPAGETDQGYLPVAPENFEYLIRFQNTGNAPAFNIRVDDDFSNNLDWSSFELISTSHYCEPSLDMGTGHAEFFFPDILLPDSVSNEPESHGFIRFRIASVPGVYEGMTIENTAYIYFDFNPAVVTNTTINTFSDEYFATTIEAVEGLQVGTYPNPTTGAVTVTLQGAEVDQLTLLSLDGKRLIQQRPAGPQTELDLKDLASGLYLLRATDRQGNTLSTTRVVKR